VLSGCHSRLSAFAVVIAAAATVTVLLCLAGSAHAATLQEQRAKAKDLAAQVAAFDARIAQAAQRALAEAEERRAQKDKEQAKKQLPPELGGPKGLEPTRYGDWERKGIVSDF
jgi:hypothetical protein